jgi:hypothetical protein
MTVLLEFVAREPTHVAAGARVRDVVDTPHDIPPQRQHFLSLDELSSRVSVHSQQVDVICATNIHSPAPADSCHAHAAARRAWRSRWHNGATWLVRSEPSEYGVSSNWGQEFNAREAQQARWMVTMATMRLHLRLGG